MGRRPRPFDARLYFEYRLFREFSNGIPDQWLTHAATAVHHIMDDYFPISVVASGGVLVYPDGRESSDTFGATLLYPKGFLFTYAAMFGNNYPGHVRYFGQNGTIERVGGDDDGTYVVKGLGGGDRPEKIKQDIPLPPIAPTNHIKNWLECMRSRTDAHRRRAQRLRPLGGVDHGRPIGMDGQEAVLGRPARGHRRQAGGLRRSSLSPYPVGRLRGERRRPIDVGPSRQGGLQCFSIASGSWGWRWRCWAPAGASRSAMFNRGQAAAQPALAGFEGVQIGPGLSADISVGGDFAVAIEGDRALVRQVSARVENQNLVVTRTPGGARDGPAGTPARGAAEAAPAAGRRRPRVRGGRGRAEAGHRRPRSRHRERQRPRRRPPVLTASDGSRVVLAGVAQTLDVSLSGGSRGDARQLSAAQRPRQSGPGLSPGSPPRTRGLGQGHRRVPAGGLEQAEARGRGHPRRLRRGLRPLTARRRAAGVSPGPAPAATARSGASAPSPGSGESARPAGRGSSARGRPPGKSPRRPPAPAPCPPGR